MEKRFKVYIIRDTTGKVVGAGMTERSLERRFNERKGSSHNPGEFYNRNDLSIHLYADFDNKKESFLCEGSVKLANGLEWSEMTNCVNRGKINGQTSMSIERTCPDCNRIIKGASYFQHIVACKQKITKNGTTNP